MRSTGRRWAIIAACAGALLSLAPVARAQDVPMPNEQVLGDVPYMNGGVGEEEVTFIKQQMKDYTLRLAFSRAGTPRAEYVASVAVTITDAKGANIFELASTGPYLLLKVPPGRYAVTATYENQTVTRPLVAGKGSTPINFVWK
jgi:hypothetical protein